MKDIKDGDLCVCNIWGLGGITIGRFRGEGKKPNTYLIEDTKGNFHVFDKNKVIKDESALSYLKYIQ
jgi:hypothetical protein